MEKERQKTLLNVASWQTNVQTLGPGKRFVLWVQGCPFSCPGCLAEDWIPFQVKHPISVDNMAEMILQSSNISGITISGGEPMMQAGRLTELISRVHAQRPNLDIIVFTGFQRKQLIWEEAERFMNHIDLLISGLYVEKLNDGIGLRGSNNQKIDFLSDRLLDQKESILYGERNLSFYIQSDGVLLAGIPQQNFHW